MSRSGDFSEYRLTDALTRHVKVGPKSSLDEGVVVAVRDPQFLELRSAAVEAAASDSAGHLGAHRNPISRAGAEGLVVSASHCGSTLDLVVPWGNSSLDLLETSLSMFQNAVKDTHDMWKREMETRINELVNQKIEKSENPNQILADAYVSERNQRRAQLETNEGIR